jgi:DNA topoisomerase IA|tara:strand:+ start:139 stop:459 length:321 start_codon:yes stop_codon:yes gene_type:complete
MKFVNLLSAVNYPTSNQQKQELWDVEGIIKKHSNQKFKFDLRPLKNNIKKGFFKTKADKMVFDIKDRYIVVDVEELHEYLKDKELKMVYLEELISKLDWNIILLKI